MGNIIKYTEKGGLIVKPSDVVKYGAGKEFIHKMSNSKLAKYIREGKT